MDGAASPAPGVESKLIEGQALPQTGVIEKARVCRGVPVLSAIAGFCSGFGGASTIRL